MTEAPVRDVERAVANHYAHGSLERAILAALEASGKDLDRLVPDDLAPVDEFHIGGRNATVELVSQLDLAPGRRLLDVGCGLGGAARYCARTHGCTVTGVDLSEEYVRTAERLTARVGLESLVSFRQASARALPFEAGTFDVVTMLHVGMNVRDKAALFGEIRRVLAPGGELGVYDVLRESDGEAIPYPMPWATSAETSFVGTEATYRSALEQAGFEVRTCRSRRESAIEFFQRMRAQAQASGGPPRLGLHVLMGPSAPQKIANMIDAVERRLIAPTAIVARSKA